MANEHTRDAVGWCGKRAGKARGGRSKMSQRHARRTAARNSCQKKLHDKLLFKSDAPLWDDARFEWKRGDTYWCSSWGSCVCDHRIRERCEIHNTRNGEQAVVGNCCINQFLARLHISEPTRSMIASIRKVQRDPSRALNKYTLHVAQQNRVITEVKQKFGQHLD